MGGGISSRIFSLPGNWFTTTDFLKLTQSALHQRTASIRRYTEPKEILYLALFGVCVDGHRGSLFSDKANFIISVHRQNCGPKKIINYCVLLEDLTKQIIKSGPKTKPKH